MINNSYNELELNEKLQGHHSIILYPEKEYSFLSKELEKNEHK